MTTVRARLALALAPCWVIAACAGRPAPPPAPAPTGPAPGQLDGLYRGTSTRFRADSRACPSPGLVVLRVVGGQFEYRWNGRTLVDASIAPDGTVVGGFEAITLNGRLAGNRIEGDVSSDSCAYHFRALKRAQ